MTAELVNSGHNYLGINGAVLARSAVLDAEVGVSPGPLFQALSKLIGGKAAEPQSHVINVARCIKEIWLTPSTLNYWETVTGTLLGRLISERQEDYTYILRSLLLLAEDRPAIFNYIQDWVRGHFIPLGTLP
jgi:hypothetical protein